MARRSGTLILCDGDIASLICVMHASEEGASERAGLEPARVVLAPVHCTHSAQRASIGRHAAFYGAEVADALPTDMNDTDMLLAAGRSALDQNLARVLWPVHAGIAGDAEGIDIERVAAIANTTTLVERLLEVEDANAPMLHAPHLDLCDRQIADLAIDLGLVPGDVWWTSALDDEQQLAFERWAAAFEASGAPLRLKRASDAGGRGA